MKMSLPDWLNEEAATSPVPGDLLRNADTRPAFIYGLVDPRTGKVRYIGKSIRPLERLGNHLNDPTRCHRTNWLRELRSAGLKPGIVMLERLTGMWPWQEAERFWIEYGRRMGWSLTNNTLGGDGVPGLPEETRQRMRCVWLNRRHRPETIEKLRAAGRLRSATEATRARISAAHRGRQILWIDKIRARLRKLSAADQEQIRTRLATGERVWKLAEEYGVHRTTISKVKNGTYE